MLESSQIAFTIAIATVISLLYLTYTIIFKKVDKTNDEQVDDQHETSKI